MSATDNSTEGAQQPMSTRFISSSFITLFVALVVLAAGAGGRSTDAKLASNGALSGGLWGMQISSPAIGNDNILPVKYTQDGQNISPPLQWSNGPSGTREFVLMVEDPDAPGDTPYLHWFVYRMP